MYYGKLKVKVKLVEVENVLFFGFKWQCNDNLRIVVTKCQPAVSHDGMLLSPEECASDDIRSNVFVL